MSDEIDAESSGFDLADVFTEEWAGKTAEY